MFSGFGCGLIGEVIEVIVGVIYGVFGWVV